MAMQSHVHVSERVGAQVQGRALVYIRMRRRLVGALLACTIVGVAPSAAQAGYAHYEIRNGTIGNVIPRFNAGPGEKPDLRIQVVDINTVVFEDLANPITPGPPPVAVNANASLLTGELPLYANAQPCEPISTHAARCTAGPGEPLREIEVDTGLLAAKVRDVPGGAHRPIRVFSGRLSDDIELLSHEAAQVQDAGGNNRIRLGAGTGGLWEPTNSISVGPGNSVINVRNGTLRDEVDCLLGAPLGGHAFVDPGDVVSGCKNVYVG